MKKLRRFRTVAGEIIVFAMLATGNGLLEAAPAEAKKQQVPPFYQNAEAAKPFPRTLAPETFQNPAVVHAHRVAKEIPEVLAQQPCYCSCDRIGHRSLLDCFASRHAESCLICTNEAILAERMTRAKKTPREIREAMIRGDWRSLK